MLRDPDHRTLMGAILNWLADPSERPFFRIFGHAGTGKTSAATGIASIVNGTVLFAAPTGKAAHILRQKGCEPVSTIHSLIYTSHEKSEAKLANLVEMLENAQAMVSMNNPDLETLAMQIKQLEFEIANERKNLANPHFVINALSELRGASLLILDEASMIDERLACDVLGFRTPVLLLADPGQLPPVRGLGYFMEGNPDVMLERIHRQAQGNPILDLAYQARLGLKLELGTYGSSRVVTKSTVTKEMGESAEQIIVGRNTTRRTYNKRIRQLRGHDGTYPQVSDRLVCLRNNHDLGLLNGAIWNCVESSDEPDDCDHVRCVIEPEEGGEPQLVTMHASHFRGEQSGFRLGTDADEFDYGYALTCHKCQGSQWRDVMIFDESHMFQANAKKWLYTAITRASESVTIVQ